MKILVNRAIFCYENNICLYWMLCILTPVGHHEASVNKKYGDTSRHITTTTLLGWCHHIYSISTHNSAQIILSVVYILTVLCKTWHYIFVNCFDILCSISLKEHLPEDAHIKWPKHVAGYTVYTKINLHIFICIWLCFSLWKSRWINCS